ncbi:diphosphomevalonate decarboxylase [Listeria ivanovii]|uniref:diphosphomevalonate decarboxylase n=2 Tax=Listeria ivanovii TaxID=1638 RepID=A0ABS1G278_LISIV|nr:diphosphomevalonate decarboxylase [Listeria ivanovii]AIS58514.1 diphosphomevalonate decarboxylase [Listeria ivanovii subsp. londoniensis]AIS61268.1 diphosphomevalonate decarboxylase [Listeria ivanovii subsp. londoniensis]MBC2255449.1 diphosphomevalonate decarboxylase [Listeria ivanovii]MBK1960967.1 diphosphomevalonate decarboxylase [Listeria ivanovii subsp. londoniensis]MBK1966210.1 diphosphomevalonate decarboxylase [Listeria ivanovii subsp. londoniensis]
MRATAIAHTNVALIKYWGKRDEQLILPANSSLSFTVDKFYTKTTIEWDDNLKHDRFILDGEEKTDAKVTRFIDKMREEFGLNARALIISENHVPTAAGLASSASAFAALALAGSHAAGRNDTQQYISKLARFGSGSASRSIYGDFVIWEKGELADGSDSFAVPFTKKLSDKISMVIAVVSDKKKKVSSRDGMRSTVETSPFFKNWVAAAESDLEEMKQAILAEDFIKVGEITEQNGMKMHATTLGAEPPFTYFKPLSLEIMDAVRELRGNGIPAYFTMDAGPNVKVICERKNERIVAEKLSELTKNVLICHAGKEASVVSDEK